MTELASSESRKPRSIAVAVVRHGDWVLVGQRPQNVPLAGFAEFPGGKVEPNEPPESAAVRECREEAGIEIEVLGNLAVVEHQYEHGTLRLHFFAAQPISPDRPSAHASESDGPDGATQDVSFRAGTREPAEKASGLTGRPPVELQGSFRWVAVQALRDLKFPPANSAVLQLLAPR